MIYRYLRAGTTLLTLTAVFITVFFVFWASHRGLDITDEGFYLLAAQFPHAVKLWPNVAHVYTGFLYLLSHDNIVWFRLSGLFLTLLSASILFIGLNQLFDRFNLSLTNHRIASLAFINLGALLYYFAFLTSPSYNLLNSAILDTATGLFFLYLFYNEIALLFGAGLLIGCDLFIKFPTSIILSLVFTLLLVYWDDNLSKLRSIVWLSLGIATWISVHLLFIQAPSTLYHIITDGIYYETTMNPERHVFMALHQYLFDLFAILKVVIHHFWKLYIAFALGLVLLFRRVGQPNKWQLSVAIFSLLIYVGFFWKIYQLGFYHSGTRYPTMAFQFYVTLFIMLLDNFFVLYFLSRLNPLSFQHAIILQKPLVLTFLLLFILPFAGALGTLNPIAANVTFSIAPWFGCFIMLLLLISKLYNRPWVIQIGICVISLMTAGQIISGALIDPSRLNTNLWKQNKLTAIGVPASYLKLDSESSEFFNSLSRVAASCGFKPGEDILALSDMPGVVFALGGKSPAIPWFIVGHVNSRAANLIALRFAPIASLKKAFILETQDGDYLLPDLALLGIQFPADYVLCSDEKLTWPVTKNQVRFWKPRD